MTKKLIAIPEGNLLRIAATKTLTTLTGGLSISRKSRKPKPSPDQMCERFWTLPGEGHRVRGRRHAPRLHSAAASLYARPPRRGARPQFRLRQGSLSGQNPGAPHRFRAHRLPLRRFSLTGCGDGFGLSLPIRRGFVDDRVIGRVRDREAGPRVSHSSTDSTLGRPRSSGRLSHLGSTAPDQRSQRSVALWNISPGRQCSFMRQSLIRTRQALSRGPFAIYRNTGWGLEVLFIEGVNGERVEVAEINALCERACVCAQELLRKKQKGEKIERPREHARSNVVNLMDARR
jgi:hypothetical protein